MWRKDVFRVLIYLLIDDLVCKVSCPYIPHGPVVNVVSPTTYNDLTYLPYLTHFKTVPTRTPQSSSDKGKISIL